MKFHFANPQKYKLINFRVLDSVLSAQFLFDLYDQYHPSINVYRFRNVLGIFRDGAMYTYAPKEDWQYIVQQITNTAQTEDYRLYMNEFEKLFLYRKDHLLNTIKEYDQLKLTPRNQESMLLKWLHKLYYVPLNEIFFLSLVPVEVGYFEAIRQVAQSEGISEKAIYTLLDWASHKYGEKSTSEQHQMRMIKLAYRQLEGKDVHQQLIELFDDMCEASIGYGSAEPDRAVFEQEYLNLQESIKSNSLSLLNGRDTSPDLPPVNISETLLNRIIDYVKIGSYRDYNKAMLGKGVKRRQHLLTIIGNKYDLENEVRYYLFEELVELLRNNTRVSGIEDRRQAVSFQSCLQCTQGTEAINQALVTRPKINQKTHLSGIPASQGHVEGYARIIDKNQIQISSEDIIVTLGTDFNMLEQMRVCKGIITSEGGILSHASVVAREMKKPCLIGVENALQYISDGDYIELNAVEGFVKILKPHPITVPKLPISLLNGEISEIGNKAHWLKRVQNIRGILVPDFMMITVEDQKMCLQEIGVSTKDFLAYNKNEQIYLLEHIPMPTKLQRKITDFLDSLNNNSVAIRSSGINEDSVSASFAGQYKSFLYIPNQLNNVWNVVKKVWLSSYQDNVSLYSQQNGIEIDMFLPTIIQEMILSTVSGIAFTRNPVNGAEEIIIELSQGNCEKLTSGKRPDDHVTVPYGELPISPLLSSNEAMKLSVMLDTLMTHFGSDLDIEFSFDSIGDLYVLQVRPITTIEV